MRGKTTRRRQPKSRHYVKKTRCGGKNKSKKSDKSDKSDKFRQTPLEQFTDEALTDNLGYQSETHQQTQSVLSGRDRFRRAVIASVKSGPSKAVSSEAIIKIFESNRESINGHIVAIKSNDKSNPNKYFPIDKYSEEYEKLDSKVQSYIVPVLVIYISLVEDDAELKSIIDGFIEQGGNINLCSLNHDITALSVAQKLGRTEIADYLVANGATDKMTNPTDQIDAFLEKYADYEDHMAEEIKDDIKSKSATTEDFFLPEPVPSEQEPLQVTEVMPPPAPLLEPTKQSKQKQKNSSRSNKQVLQRENATKEHAIKAWRSQYAKINLNPTFMPQQQYVYVIDWMRTPEPSLVNSPNVFFPLFNENNGTNSLTYLRNAIQHIWNQQIAIYNPNTQQTLWQICAIIQRFFPAFYVNFLPQQQFTETALDFETYNKHLCAIMLIYSIISYRMISQNYIPVFKGGKAIQLVTIRPYLTEDIDLIIIPYNGHMYNAEEAKRVAGHISYLTQWFLGEATVSVLDPPRPGTRAFGNPYIYKLSYIKQNPNRIDERTGKPIRQYKQMSDIDFKPVPQEASSFFTDIINFSLFITELNTPVLFICPTLKSMLNEKTYYSIKYLNFKNIIMTNRRITEPGYENLTLEECDRMIEKFGRAVDALTSK